MIRYIDSLLDQDFLDHGFESGLSTAFSGLKRFKYKPGDKALVASLSLRSIPSFPLSNHPSRAGRLHEFFISLPLNRNPPNISDFCWTKYVKNGFEDPSKYKAR